MKNDVKNTEENALDLMTSAFTLALGTLALHDYAEADRIGANYRAALARRATPERSEGKPAGNAAPALDALFSVRNYAETKGDAELYSIAVRGILTQHLASHAGAAPGWISVEDRLPEIDIPVIAFNGQRVLAVVMGKATAGHNYWMRARWLSGGTLHTEDGGDLLAYSPVTHWMPLPAAPSNPPGKP